VQSESDPEAIEAWADIRGAAGDPDGDRCGHGA
jgi:hypothetical protein